jgi:hypothetical protein
VRLKLDIKYRITSAKPMHSLFFYEYPYYGNTLPRHFLLMDFCLPSGSNLRRGSVENKINYIEFVQQVKTSFLPLDKIKSIKKCFISIQLLYFYLNLYIVSNSKISNGALAIRVRIT